jgi:ribA/ribD-fused uncharacterized protein
MINFYKTKEPYGEFSNFSRYPVLIDGKMWPTTEHYYQAQKMVEECDREEIRMSKSPRDAANLGRDRNKKIWPNWESIKEGVMKVALYAKFTQYEELRNLLMQTGDEGLAEHTENDNYWGDGLGKGLNRLGILLMEVRESLK